MKMLRLNLLKENVVIYIKQSINHMYLIIQASPIIQSYVSNYPIQSYCYEREKKQFCY